MTCFGTVIVNSGPLASITVTPTPVSVQAGATQLFTASGKDVSGGAFVITPVWSVVNGGGSINPITGVFTAGATAGTFTSTIKATSGTVFGACERHGDSLRAVAGDDHGDPAGFRADFQVSSAYRSIRAVSPENTVRATPSSDQVPAPRYRPCSA